MLYIETVNRLHNTNLMLMQLERKELVQFCQPIQQILSHAQLMPKISYYLSYGSNATKNIMGIECW